VLLFRRKTLTKRHIKGSVHNTTQPNDDITAIQILSSKSGASLQVYHVQSSARRAALAGGPLLLDVLHFLIAEKHATLSLLLRKCFVPAVEGDAGGSTIRAGRRYPPQARPDCSSDTIAYKGI
jgi:hypothetical protein